MPGPAASIDPIRRNARVGTLKLPAEGRKGKPPVWPLDDVFDGEPERWKALWATPQATAWDRMGDGVVLVVARYCRMVVSSETGKPNAAVLSHVMALEDRLGLTPKAMRMLLWEIVTDEVAEKREERTSSARGRIKAVS
jgi:hypothetical protein